MLDRYRLIQTPTSRYAKMEKHPDGEFVLHEDHLDAISEERQLTMSIEIINKIKGEENGSNESNY